MAEPAPRWGTGERLVLDRVGYDDAAAAALVEAVQQEYVTRYGARDDTPVDPAQFAPPRGGFLLGRVAGVPVACGGWRRAAVEGAAVAELKRMYVVPAARGRGYARALLAALEADAAAAGCTAVRLETGTRQPEAIALYRSAGYRPIAGFGHYRDAPESRCFGKTLDPVPGSR